MVQNNKRRVTIMGLGLYQEGSGVSAARYFLEQEWNVTITDKKSENELHENIKQLKHLHTSLHLNTTLEFHLGKHDERDFQGKNTDLIVKNPAVPNASPYLERARRENIPITSDTALFFEQFTGTIIGITGTRGKSTTTALIYTIVKKQKKDAFLGGNIMISPLKFLKKARDSNNIAVLELPAQQLTSIQSLRRSPDISVFTNIYPDHENFYTSPRQYFQQKKLILKYQKKNDIAVLNYDQRKIRTLKILGQAYYFSLKELPKNIPGAYLSKNQLVFRSRKGREERIIDRKDATLQGQHNMQNMLAAIAATKTFGIQTKHIRSVLKNFSGLPYRLQMVKKKNGLIWMNDATSTTPESAIAAIETITEQFPNYQKTLIAGGIAKVPRYDHLGKAIKENFDHLIFLPGTAGEKITTALPTSWQTNIIRTPNLTKAIKLATKITKHPGVIVFSPAGASFNQFKNEIDRAEQFNRLIP